MSTTQEHINNIETVKRMMSTLSKLFHEGKLSEGELFENILKESPSWIEFSTLAAEKVGSAEVHLNSCKLLEPDKLDDTLKRLKLLKLGEIYNV